MARFTVFSIAVVATVAIYTNQVAAQNGVEAVNADDGPYCIKPDSSDCLSQLPSCGANTRCCSGLRYGVANNGTTWALNTGKCVCCNVGKCHRQYSGAVSSTPNTAADAQAFDQECQSQSA